MNLSSPCAIAGNCTFSVGATVPGELTEPPYDPNYPVPYWHQRIEFAAILTCNILSFAIIVARVYYRRRTLKRFIVGDHVMTGAAVVLIPFTLCQVMSVVYGGGLHSQNIPDAWPELHWYWEFGFSGYYIICSLIKMSACFCFDELLPPMMKTLRRCVFALCIFIFLLGLTVSVIWQAGCTPFLSNFLWDVEAITCVNMDILKWLWIALSVIIDIILICIPWQLLRRVNLQNHEKKVLRMTFAAIFLGTATCIIGIWGVWDNQTSFIEDQTYQETLFVIFNDVEILMYAVGASVPVLSRYFVAHAAPETRSTHYNFSSFANRLPDFNVPSEIGDVSSESENASTAKNEWP